MRSLAPAPIFLKVYAPLLPVSLFPYLALDFLSPHLGGRSSGNFLAFRPSGRQIKLAEPRSLGTRSSRESAGDKGGVGAKISRRRDRAGSSPFIFQFRSDKSFARRGPTFQVTFVIVS